MSEIHYVERVPRRYDFCGCPPCSLCYEPVLTDDQQAPTFQEVMQEIYVEGPMPQNEQEYEWAHAAAHQCRKELEEHKPTGEFFEAADRAKMTQMQIDDLLKTAKKASEAPKPLNRVNLDDMAVEQTEGVEKGMDAVKQREAVKRAADYEAYMASMERERARALGQQVNLQNAALVNAALVGIGGDPSAPGANSSRR